MVGCFLSFVRLFVFVLFVFSFGFGLFVSLYVCSLPCALLKSEWFFELFYTLIFSKCSVRFCCVFHFISNFCHFVVSCAQFNAIYIPFASL